MNDHGPAPRIRPTTDDDLDAVVAIHAAVAAEGRWIGREAPVPVDEVRAQMAAALTDDSQVRLVAEFDGAVVGHAGARDDGHGHAELFMAIAAGHRGRGIGGRLVDGIVAWATGRPSVHKVTLQVWPHNEAALALYRSRGFQVEGYLHRHWRRRNGELWDAVVMGLVLPHQLPDRPVDTCGT